MSLESRKRNITRKTAAVANKLSTASSDKYADPNVWLLKRNKDKVGQATIRFLEPNDADIEYAVSRGLNEDEVPFYSTKHEHGFQGPNGNWYFENCPTSNEERDCPVCDANSVIVEEGGGWSDMLDTHPGKVLVRKRARRQTYYANILIIDDPLVPENNNKVKIFKFGPAIFNMIKGQLIPEFEDESPCDISNFWEGKDFKFKIFGKNGRACYDKSTWLGTSEIGDDEFIDGLLKQLYTLHTYTTPDQYKSYPELTRAFNKTQNADDVRPVVEDDAPDAPPVKDSKPEETPKRRSRATPKTESAPTPPETTASSSEVDPLSDEYFNSLLTDEPY